MLRRLWLLLSPAAVIFACGKTSEGNPDGAPTLECTGGSSQCGDTCVVLGRDRENCGACGTKCADGELCSAGKCGNTCTGGAVKCADKCADLKIDPANCGQCMNACAPGMVCSVGKCAVQCGGGSTQCGMSCADVGSDRFNCGMCGVACATGEDCVQGMCELQCQQGLVRCATPDAGIYPPDAGDAAMLGPEVCTNTNIDPFNCGSCGTPCGGGKPKCLNGVCVLADAGN